MKNIIKKLSLSVLFIVFLGAAALADKTSVTIDVVKSAKKGSEITITVNVKHSANTGFHHTEWVYIKINGIEVKRWDFSKTNLPSSENFTLTFKYIFNEAVKIEAQGNCNLHGSADIAKTDVIVE